METPRILVLCGGRFAFPALQQLGFEKYLCGVGVGKGEPDVLKILENESKHGGFAYNSFSDRASLKGLRAWIDELNPDYIFSISFPFLLSEEVLSYGAKKFINFHPGPLPQYRGPMPLFEVLRYGENETAISVHFMNSEFDEGDLILKETIPIESIDTYGILAVKMSERMALVCLNIAEMVQYGSFIPSQTQNPGDARYFEKPEAEDTNIRWRQMSATEIIDLIKACNPWNQGADALFMGSPVKLISAELSQEQHSVNPGIITETSEKAVSVACIDGEVIDIHIIGGEKGILTAQQFAGLKPIIGSSFN